jgi:plastocyanin
MTSRSPVFFWYTCAIMLILTCSFSGCTYPQSPAITPTITPAPSYGSNTVVINNFAFNPANLTIRTGATVTWLNQNGAVHQIDSDQNTPVAFTSSSLAHGESFSFTFTQPGTYTYHCVYHSLETGTIVVES